MVIYFLAQLSSAEQRCVQLVSFFVSFQILTVYRLIRSISVVEMSSLSYYDAMELPPGTPPQIGDRYVIDTDEGQKMAVIKNYNEGKRSFALFIRVVDENRHPLVSGVGVELNKSFKSRFIDSVMDIFLKKYYRNVNCLMVTKVRKRSE